MSISQNKAKCDRPEPFVAFNSPQLRSDLLSKLDRELMYGFYGPFNASSLAQSGAQFIAAQSDGNRYALAAALSTFLPLAYNDCLKTCDSADSPAIGTACWLCIRAFRPTDEYIQPRWHRDGRMFQCTGNADPPVPHSKYAVSLLGPPTRVLAPSVNIDRVMTLKRYEENRATLAEKLTGYDDIPLKPRQIIRFSWGEEDSPVHSEPDFSGQDRVFVSVLFGSEQEIKDMCKKRNKTYGKEEYSS